MSGRLYATEMLVFEKCCVHIKMSRSIHDGLSVLSLRCTLSSELCSREKASIFDRMHSFSCFISLKFLKVFVSRIT